MLAPFAAPAAVAPRTTLITSHLPMARRIARSASRLVPAWLGRDDLESAAVLGLTEAADRFDPARGEAFAAYAARRIRGAVLDELRRGDILPRRARRAARQIGETIRELESTLGRSPEDHEVAKALDVTLDDYRGHLEQLTQVRIVELTGEAEGGDGQPGLDDKVAHAQLVGRLRGALETLPPRDVRVLALYYVEELSYAEIGKVLGVTESRVCQLHGRAVARLRSSLSDH